MDSHFALLDSNNTVIAVEAVTADFVAANPDRYQGRWEHCNPPRSFCGVGWKFDEQAADFFPPDEPTEA